MKDKNGKRLSSQQLRKPKWPEPYDKPIYVAGFKLLNYIGYRYYGQQRKGAHWYIVICLECGSQYERYQGSLTRAVSKGTRGCAKCAKKRFAEDKKHAKERERHERIKSLQFWLWANFLMPVTSLRLRNEMERCFDNEKTKVLGWRTI